MFRQIEKSISQGGREALPALLRRGTRQAGFSVSHLRQGFGGHGQFSVTHPQPLFLEGSTCGNSSLFVLNLGKTIFH